MSAQPKQPALRLRVSPVAETLARGGHPWVFAASVRAQNREGAAGELAVIFDRRDQFLAVGLFDPASPIRVRILHAGKPQIIDNDWWRAQFQKALARRETLFGENTTGYRCLNGESDGWPGLVLDRYDATLVVKLYTAAWLPRLAEIAEIFAARTCLLVLRLSRNIAKTAAAQFRLEDGQILKGEPLSVPVIFRENGLRFEADVLRGQKTGFFLDQRENRRMIETMSAGRTVLNLFSYSGGFTLYAERGGASSVCSVDMSARALATAERNFRLNREIPPVSRCAHETIQADAFDWLREAPPRKFDLIVLDPPSLAKREAERPDALRAYSALISAALARLNPAGILAAASCSAHVSTEDFFQLARTAARQSARLFEELQTTTHAPDHPATFPEAQYLKCIYFRVT
jgi:23S rRNA (cytosine1962-C5)-methyltransferase